MSYDGKGSVSDKLGVLYGISGYKALNTKMAEARLTLGYPTKGKLSLEQNIAIYQYHLDKINCVKYHTSIQDDSFKLVNFAIKLSDRRTSLSLETYVVDALKSKFTLKSNGEVRAWLEQLPIDGNQPIARQAMFWIIQRLLEINAKTRKNYA